MPFIEPTQEQSAALLARAIDGPVVMCNLLRFREVADYGRSPELAPDEPVSGAAAYRTYAAHTEPHLAAVGGEVTFVGGGGPAMIGPVDEHWDLMLLVRYPSVDAFLSMVTSEGYLEGVGHRTAALEDSRLHPLVVDTIGALTG